MKKVVNKIASRFGFKVIGQSEYDRLVEDSLSSGEYFQKLHIYKAENQNLKGRLEREKDNIHGVFVDYDQADPAPKDQLKRKNYVASVAGLYNSVLEPKLKQMIANARIDLQRVDNKKEQDLILKGAIYSLEEFLRWGYMMTLEHRSSEQENIASEKDAKGEVLEEDNN